MKEITEELIDEVLNKSFLDACDNISMQYANNLKGYSEGLKDCDPVLQQGAPYFASMKTAQDNMLETIRKTLKELLLD